MDSVVGLGSVQRALSSLTRHLQIFGKGGIADRNENDEDNNDRWTAMRPDQHF